MALLQLASLAGDIFPTYWKDEGQPHGTANAHMAQYLSTYLSSLLPLLKELLASLSSSSPTATLSALSSNFSLISDIGDIIVRLSENFRLNTFLSLPIDQSAATFFEDICTFTCICLQSLKTVEEVETSWNVRCFQNLLSAWLLFGTVSPKKKNSEGEQPRDEMMNNRVR